MGLDFPGDTYPETTILATTPFDFNEVFEGLSNVNYIWTQHPAFSGTFSLLRVPGKWRASLYPAPGESVEDALLPEAIERKLQAIHPKGTPYDLPDLRPYRIHQRIVESYRNGRLLLAGDAAHLNSPSGGMGMNGGIHDAMELAATLAAIRRGRADDGLLVPFFNPEKIAETVLQVFNDPAGHAHLAAAGRQSIIDRYDLRTVSLPRQLDLVERLAAGVEPPAEAGA